MGERLLRRRAEDRSTLGYVEEIATWVRRGPRVLVAAFAFVTGAAAVASWLGAQASSPSQRILRLETRVDSGFHVLDSSIAELRTVQEAAARLSTVTEEKLDILLRIGCPTITRADLIRACRLQGAIR